MFVLDMIPHWPRITARWVLLGLLATVRKCWFLTEQPRSSLMPYFAYIKYMALKIAPIRWGSISLSWAYSAQWPTMLHYALHTQLCHESTVPPSILLFINSGLGCHDLHEPSSMGCYGHQSLPTLCFGTVPCPQSRNHL